MRSGEQELAQQEEELLGLHLMGDIREDAEVLGLRLKDMVSIMIITLLAGLMPFLLPIPILVKVSWLAILFIGTTISHMLKVPYRIKRYYYDKRFQRAKGTGALLDELLGMEEDSWFYRSKQGNVIQVLYEVKAPPWATSTLANKRLRLTHYAAFIRQCLKERFRIDVFTEQIPDYQYEVWDRKQAQVSDNPGIERLKHDRITMWTQQARTGEAQRSVYILRLTIRKSDLEGKQRDDEPADLSKEALKRHRMVAELREKQARVLSLLEQSGHRYSLLSGYALTELLSRWWDRSAWTTWKHERGDWSEEEEQQEGMSTSLKEALAESAESLEESTTIMPTNVEPVEEALVEAVPKPSRLRSWMTRIKGWISVWLAVIRGGWQRIIRTFQRYRKPRTGGTMPREEAMRHEAEHEQQREVQVGDAEQRISAQQGARSLWLVSAPAPTGTSFLTVNVAVAMSSYEQPVHVVDLSPDHGCKTLLNPLPITCEHEGWNAYVSKHAPGLTLWQPDQTQRPHAESLRAHIEQLSQESMTLVELPWYYPHRESLFAIGEPIAVVDADYHHWLQWEKATVNWQGRVWLNGMDEDLEKIYRSIVKESGWSPTRFEVFPHLAKAHMWSYQGVPAAAMDKEAFRLVLPVGEMEVSA